MVDLRAGVQFDPSDQLIDAIVVREAKMWVPMTHNFATRLSHENTQRTAKQRIKNARQPAARFPPLKMF